VVGLWGWSLFGPQGTQFLQVEIHGRLIGLMV
jgi:hypothetical protein